MISEEKPNQSQLDQSTMNLNQTGGLCNENMTLNQNIRSNKSENKKHNHNHRKYSPCMSLLIKYGSRAAFVAFMLTSMILRAYLFKTPFTPCGEFYLDLIVYGSAILVIINYLFASLTDNRQRYLEYYNGHSPEIYDKKICKKCPSDFGGNKRLKPPRTHHCSVCKTCIAKMDHHCVFIQNCVGFYNHKSYYWLLAWGSLFGIVYVSIISYNCIKVNLYLLHHHKMAWFYISIIFSIQIIVMLIGIALSVVNLGVYHTKMALFNLTTIEDLDKFRRPYHMGVLSNLKSFFGGKYQFFLPMRLSFEEPELSLIKDNVFATNAQAPYKSKEILVFKKNKKKSRMRDLAKSEDMEMEEVPPNFENKDRLAESVEYLIRKSNSNIDTSKKIVYMYAGKQIKSQDLEPK